MALMEQTKISWTDHTFNPWHGCIEVSPGCEGCYARTLSERWGRKIWGPIKTTPRMMMADAYWKAPVLWNKKALAAGVRRRVFCASMADVFEDGYPMEGGDENSLDAARWDLFELIEKTPALDWMLLTKRPENVNGMVPARWHSVGYVDTDRPDGPQWVDQPGWPRNVWIGMTAENQEWMDKRWEDFKKIPAWVKFISYEPALGPLVLPLDCISNLPFPGGWWEGGVPMHGEWYRINEFIQEIDWVICGGESGPKARPMNPDWARSVRDQCAAAGIPFHYKQWGEWIDTETAQDVIGQDDPRLGDGQRRQRGRKTRLVRLGDHVMIRTGTKDNGHMLDNVEHHAFPDEAKWQRTVYGQFVG